MDDYSTKNETLYKMLIDEAPILPRELEFFKKNAPEYIKLSNEIDMKIDALVRKSPSIADADKLGVINELQGIIVDMLYETETFHFVFGYKVGAKMMMELLNN